MINMIKLVEKDIKIVILTLSEMEKEHQKGLTDQTLKKTRLVNLKIQQQKLR